MPLRSQALRGDAKLQACLEQHSAHVTEGARGTHVGKIQRALLLLDKADIDITEIRGFLYGPGTAAAVLAYKRKRKIINPSYQTAPDNIVGKMTIASLDDELLALDQQGSPSRSKCGGFGGGADFAATPQAIADAPRRFKRQNARLSVIFQETEAAPTSGGSFMFLVQMFDRARELMAPHALRFAGEDAGLLAMIGPSIPDFEQVLSGSPASCFSVRAASEKVLQGLPQTLRVIFCPFDEKDTAFGVTDGGTLADWTFPRFCLINVRKANPDRGTVLHEMIHAAKPDKVDHDGDLRSVFAAPDKSVVRDFLPGKHAESLANSYFSTVIP